MCVMQIIDENLYYLGCSERRLMLFEGAYPVPSGMSYNSYLLKDGYNVLFDTVDRHVGEEFLENLHLALAGAELHYLVVHHMEPDHAALIDRVMSKYESTRLLCSNRTCSMLPQFFAKANWLDRVRVVADNEELELGKHKLKFMMAPMVHWPEVMVTYDEFNHTLFSADAFGSFGALDGDLYLSGSLDKMVQYLPEYRRYYTNIVGKYGAQVIKLLQKVSELEVDRICPLHGRILKEQLSFWIDYYQKWAVYLPEEKAVMIGYASIYGGTERVATMLADGLVARGVTNVVVYDVAAVHYSYLVAEAFRVSHIVLASVSYNGGLFDAMRHLLQVLIEYNLSGRRFAMIENGSWAPSAAKCMQELLQRLNGCELVGPTVSVRSRIDAGQAVALGQLVDNLTKDFVG